ncbi:MAG TPA: Uma2 family endonuclease [Fimbriiglobus sp.]|nr:Uma2 family endonuclease [Fimbriiglobus sp.]
MATAARITSRPLPATQSPPVPWDRLARFTVDEYERMIDLGILGDGERLELFEGWIVEQMPHNAPHDSAVSRLQRRLGRVMGDGWLIRVQSAIKLKASVPEPDIVVVPEPEEQYDEKRPIPRQIAILAEVADSSLKFDQQDKLRVYATSGVVVYWIVNLIDRRVEVYSQPRGGKNPTYRAHLDYGPGDAVPVVLAGKQVGLIPVREILPR